MTAGRPSDGERRAEAAARLWRRDFHTEAIPMEDLLRRSQFRHARLTHTEDDDARIVETLDFAARVGELMLRSGAGAPQVEGAVAAIAAAGGLPSLQVDITMQSLHIQAEGTSGRPVGMLRVVRSNRRDYDRLIALHALVDGFAAEEFDLAEARRRFDALKRVPRPWPAWVHTAMGAGFAAAIAAGLGATWAATLATVVIFLIVRVFSRAPAIAGLPDFYVNALSALAVTAMAWGWYAMGLGGVIPVNAADFAYMVAAGIVAYLPSSSMASAVEDMLSGFPVTGVGRLMSALLAFLGLIIGVALGLSFVVRLARGLGGVAMPPDLLDLREIQAPLSAVLGYAFLVGFFGAILLQVPWRVALPGGVLTVVVAATYAGLARFVGLGAITATGLSAIVLGFLARIYVARARKPTPVLAIPATYTLLPGLAIFRGLLEMVSEAGQDGPAWTAVIGGITTLLGAFAVLLALSTGVVLGEFMGAPWDKRLRQTLLRRRR